MSKGEEMLNRAEERFSAGVFEEAERVFSEALGFLDGIDIQRSELEDMFARGREGIIRAKLGKGRGKMQVADTLFKNAKYYDAKEEYKRAREYLEGVMDEATGYKLSGLIEEINNLIQACTQNISASTTALTDVGVLNRRL